jgi:hypothetical protein
LPGQWRRWEQHWHMPIPFGINSLDYRTKIFATVFRRFNLNNLAHLDSFMEMLARETDPSLVNLISPLARRINQADTIDVRTGEEIVHWVQETIILHASASNEPTSQEFWINAVR